MRRPPVAPGESRRTSMGYVSVKMPGHPRADVNGWVWQHVLVAEKAVGHPFRKTAPVHHVDEDPSNNSSGNLVVCQDHAYHRLLHLRQVAFDACGCPDWRRCIYCRAYDDVSTMVRHAKGGRTEQLCHRQCRIDHQRAQRRAVA